MAIAFDAVSSGVRTSTGTTLTANHTFGGSDRACLVNVTYFSNPGVGPAGSNPLTVGGSTSGVTLVNHEADAAGDDRKRHVVYKVIGPASGAQAVVFTAAGDMIDGAIEVCSLTGVDQTTPVGTHQIAEGESTTPTAPAVTSATDELVLDAVAAWFPAGTTAVGAGQTARIENENWSDNEAAASMSTKPGASSVTMTNTLGTSAPWSILAIPFKPAAAGGGNQTMIAESGSYTLTGQTATLTKVRTMTMDTGTYSLLGSEGLRDISMTSDNGAYALNGQAINLVAPRILLAVFGSYLLNGQNLTLTYSAAVVQSIVRVIRGSFAFGARLIRR